MERQPLGAYLALRRKQLSLSQSDVANSLGYTSQAISKFEAGDSSLTIMVLPNLANLCKLSLDDLLLMNPHPASFSDVNPPFDGNRITTNIIRLRLSHHLSQSQEAEVLDVAKRTIIHYEKGESLPSLDAVERLITFYQITPHAFFYEDLHKEIALPSETRGTIAKPLLLLLMGFVLGGGVLTSILVPTLRRSSSTSSLPYQYNSSTSVSTSSSSTSSSAIPGLSKLVVITTSGQAQTSSVTQGGTISYTLYAETQFYFTAASRSAYPASYSIDGFDVDTSMLHFVESSPYPVVSLTIPSDFPRGSVLTINAKITSAKDPNISFDADSIELVVYAA